MLAAPRVLAGLRPSWRSPFVVLCATYSLLFIVAFSAIGNFGIISRQRSLVYPFVIVLLTLPLGRHSASREVVASPDAHEMPVGRTPVASQASIRGCP